MIIIVINLWAFEVQMDHLIQDRRPDQDLIYKKERTHHVADLAAPAGHRVKEKGNRKLDKYLHLAREPKRL